MTHCVPMKADNEASNVVPFPLRLEVVKHNPLATAGDIISTMRADFEFAMCEAYNVGDADGLQALLALLTKCADSLLVAESMAKDLVGRIQR